MAKYGDDDDDDEVITAESLRNGPTSDSLPDDLKYASADDTACEYCGVSFLVYSEMRNLQDRLDRAESKLAAADLTSSDDLQKQLLDAQDSIADAKLAERELQQELTRTRALLDAQT